MTQPFGLDPDQSIADAIIRELDEQNLAWVLCENFDSYCQTLEENGLSPDTVRKLRPALEWTYIYAVHKLTHLADRAGDVNWCEVAEQLEQMLKGRMSTIQS